MVNVNMDDKMVQININALDCLIHHYEEYQMDMNDVMAAAALSMKLQEARGIAVSKDTTFDEPEDSDEYDINMDPEAKMPNHHWVHGKGWVPNHA